MEYGVKYCLKKTIEMLCNLRFTFGFNFSYWSSFWKGWEVKFVSCKFDIDGNIDLFELGKARTWKLLCFHRHSLLSMLWLQLIRQEESSNIFIKHPENDLKNTPQKAVENRSILYVLKVIFFWEIQQKSNSLTILFIHKMYPNIFFRKYLGLNDK